CRRDRGISVSAYNRGCMWHVSAGGRRGDALGCSVGLGRFAADELEAAQMRVAELEAENARLRVVNRLGRAPSEAGGVAFGCAGAFRIGLQSGVHVACIGPLSALYRPSYVICLSSADLREM